MAKDKRTSDGGSESILAHLAPEDFVGRHEQLEQVLSLAAHGARTRGSLVLAAPGTGASELLRQAFDQLFAQRGNATPVYFSFSHDDRTTTQAASRFLQNFLLQLVAHRRNDASIIRARPSLKDLIDLAVPSDHEWIEDLVDSFNMIRRTDDERALLALCLSAPQRAAAHGVRALLLIDDLHVAEDMRGEESIARSLLQSLAHGGEDVPFALAGLRRHVLEQMRMVGTSLGEIRTIHLQELNDKQARTLIEKSAARRDVALNEETRDLLAQQFANNPMLLGVMIDAAQRARMPLDSFLNSQKVYVDELMGGQFNHRLTLLLEHLAPQVGDRRNLIKLLHETSISPNGKSSLDVWQKRLSFNAEELRRVLQTLHRYELVGFDQMFLELSQNRVWLDYLRITYRLQIAAEPRALVFTDQLAESLKRAPQTMERYYRQSRALDLRGLLAKFDCQKIPASLFNFERFERLYKNIEPDEVAQGLVTETELVELPQTVHATSCQAYHPSIAEAADPERCVVAQGFNDADYRTKAQTAWLATDVDAKAEIGRGVAELWVERLTQVARACKLKEARLWIIAPEGFSKDAVQYLNAQKVLTSNRRQVELLEARLGVRRAGSSNRSMGGAHNEWSLTIPMDEDAELVAVQTVEQIAKRQGFDQASVNQIKTALVEACINAAEHSHSPDKKIYQHFIAESDRLVVTVASRGVRFQAVRDQEENGNTPNGNGSNGKRGWGLRLIRSLMDEVEFERTDDGARLRMTKFLKQQE